MESVDRNCENLDVVSVFLVALRMESVDRNDFPVHLADDSGASLSVWRAWIEIPREGKYYPPTGGRSPYGERG